MKNLWRNIRFAINHALSRHHSDWGSRRTAAVGRKWKEKMYGRILAGGGRFYTYLGPLFAAIGQRQEQYNWLITDFEGRISSGRVCQLNHWNLTEGHAWIDGGTLTRLAGQGNAQWSWGVFSGFDRSVTLKQALEYDLPWADGNPGFWKNPSRSAPPGADGDRGLGNASTILISRDQKAVLQFAAAFPDSMDLERYNEAEAAPDQSAAYEAWLHRGE